VRWAWGVAALTVLTHLPVAAPYGFFRDELYFIACGRHPAFGYVDQPPLVPLFAAATQAFGHSLILLRLVPALTHAATVLAVAALAELFEKKSAPIAALAVLFAPMFLGLHATLNTNIFEPLTWTLFALFVAKASLRGELRCWLWAGLVAGLSLEAKYALPFFAAPLLLGLLLENRAALFTWQAALGLGIAVLIALPSALWQLTHGLPFLELLHAAKEKNELVPPGTFVLNQFLVMNPLLAPLWLAGLAYGLSKSRARFLAIAFIGVFVEMLLLHGKDYYVAPAYGVAFALGAAAVVAWLRSTAVRTLWLSAAGAVAVFAAPLALPILPPQQLAQYLIKTHQSPQPAEKSMRGVELPSTMADMLGWPELEERVAAVWRALPDRTGAAILVSNYGEAGALDFFGSKDGLPLARSGHNQYWLWGEGLPDPQVLVGVGRLERWKAFCTDLEIAGTIGVPYAMPYEQHRPILICRGLRKPLSELWPELRNYQ
jgi:hypothetical protein